MYKIYINITPGTKIVKYQTPEQQKIEERMARVTELFEKGKMMEGAMLYEQLKKEMLEIKNDGPNLGIVKKDYSSMKMFYIANLEDLSDSFYYIPCLLERNPLRKEDLNGSVTLEEFVKQATKISKKVKLVDKKSDEVCLEGDCLYQLGDVFLIRYDDVINLEIADTDQYQIEFGEVINTDYNYETVYNQLCANIKSEGLDIKGKHV